MFSTSGSQRGDPLSIVASEQLCPPATQHPSVASLLIVYPMYQVHHGNPNPDCQGRPCPVRDGAA